MTNVPNKEVHTVQLDSFLGDFITLINPDKKSDYAPDIMGALSKMGKNVRYVRKQAIINTAQDETDNAMVESYLSMLSEGLSSQPFYLVKIGNEQVAYILDGVKRFNWLANAFWNLDKFKDQLESIATLSLKVITLKFSCIEDALSYYIENEHLFRDKSEKQSIVEGKHQALSDTRKGIVRVNKNTSELPLLIDEDRMSNFYEKLAAVIGNVNMMEVSGTDIALRERTRKSALRKREIKKVIVLFAKGVEVCEFSDWYDVCDLYTFITGDNLGRNKSTLSLTAIKTHVLRFKIRQERLD